MHRRTFGPDGRVTNSVGDYPEAVRRVAREQRVALPADPGAPGAKPDGS